MKLVRIGENWLELEKLAWIGMNSLELDNLVRNMNNLTTE